MSKKIDALAEIMKHRAPLRERAGSNNAFVRRLEKHIEDLDELIEEIYSVQCQTDWLADVD